MEVQENGRKNKTNKLGEVKSWQQVIFIWGNILFPAGLSQILD